MKSRWFVLVGIALASNVLVRAADEADDSPDAVLKAFDDSVVAEEDPNDILKEFEQASERDAKKEAQDKELAKQRKEKEENDKKAISQRDAAARKKAAEDRIKALEKEKLDQEQARLEREAQKYKEMIESLVKGALNKEDVDLKEKFKLIPISTETKFTDEGKTSTLITYAVRGLKQQSIFERGKPRVGMVCKVQIRLTNSVTREGKLEQEQQQVAECRVELAKKK